MPSSAEAVGAEGEGGTAEAGSTAERRFAWLVAAAFAALTVPRLLAHELWRDEAWQWLVVVESRSLDDLFAGMSRGGGSGYLPPILYFLARQISTSPLAMQAAHLLMASAAAFAFARWAPLRDASARSSPSATCRSSSTR